MRASEVFYQIRSDKDAVLFAMLMDIKMKGR